MVNIMPTVPYINEFYVLVPATQYLQIKCLPKVSVYVIINIHNRNNHIASAVQFLLKTLFNSKG